VIRSIQAFAMLLALLFIGACSDRGKVYPRSLDDVHAVLAGINELPPVFGSDEPDLSIDSTDPSAVVWVLRKDGSEAMRFVAKLESTGQTSTRVSLDLLAPTEGPFGNVEQRLKDHSEIKDLYLVAMDEQIASRLENRAFDATKTMAATLKAGAANAGMIANQMEAAGEAARKRDDENIRKAYADEAAGH
jgi:hypothetical protein